MANNIKLTTTGKKKRQISTSLNHFYQNPVARVSLELVLTILLILFLAIFAIKPTITTMSDLIKEIEEKEKLEQQLTQKIASLQTAQNQYLIFEPLLPFLDEAIPTNPEIIKSAKIIEKIAADNQVIIKNLSISELPGNAPDGTYFSQTSKQNMTVSLSITGDYVSIRNFVETMRNSRKSFIVDSIVFSLEEDKGDKKLSANITVKVPYFGLIEAQPKK